MDDLLSAVKTVRKDAEVRKPLLEVVSTQLARDTTVQERINVKDSDNHANNRDGKSNALPASQGPVPSNVETPEDALLMLRSQPSVQQLTSTLKRLHSGVNDRHGTFSIYASGPLQSQIIAVLVRSIIPSFWSVLEENHRSLLVQCLLSVAGLNAVVTQIKSCCQVASQTTVGKSDTGSQSLKDLISVVATALRAHEVIFTVWKSLHESNPNPTHAQVAWKAFVNLIASGKIVAVVAQAEDTLRDMGSAFKAGWLANGSEFANWLGKAVVHSCVETKSEDPPNAKSLPEITQIYAKGMNMGYPLPLVRGLMAALFDLPTSSDRASPSAILHPILVYLPSLAKRQFLEHTLRWQSALLMQMSTFDAASIGVQRSEVTALAALIYSIIIADQAYQDHLQTFLSDQVLSSSVSFVIRRATIATLAAAAQAELPNLLEKIIENFGDPLFINHAPVLQQEAVAQSILLIAGYLQRKSPMGLHLTVRSANHMRGVSNRLSSSNTKARWLGMVVGTALSKLVDKSGSALNFGTEDMQTAEAQWYLKITEIDDAVGSLSDFARILKASANSVRNRRRVKPVGTEILPIINGKQTFGPSRPPELLQTQIIGERVTEVLDDDDENERSGLDDGFQPYAKPDSDPEDSDEDATLVNRRKAKPPVYVRDLMAMLRDDKDFDRFDLGIKHAAGLIRRKTGFGGEVRDHAQELGSILCNLQDPFDTDNFDELKLRALIAVLLSDPAAIGPWLGRQAFLGDYSLSQRCAILSAIGLGGRELGGVTEQDELNPVPAEARNGFPSKRLPGRLHNLYDPANPSVAKLDAASTDVEHGIVQPLALSAADESTSHLNAVKVRTFSSRLTSEKNRTYRKPAANQLARIFGESFFAPLLTAYQQEVAAYGPSSVYVSVPMLLVTFLKTLALLLHAAGPASLNLADITTTYWDLLLALHNSPAAADISVLEALLFALLTLFETNSERKRALLQDNPAQLAQSQQWVEAVFERVGGSGLDIDGSRDEVRVRTLAAAVLVKIQEIGALYREIVTGSYVR